MRDLAARSIPEPNTGCWLWLLAVDRNGYPFVFIEGKRKYAHRVSLAQKLGHDLAPGEVALHGCDQPACVNPDHLHPGTHLQNMAEMRSRGRSAVGARNGQHRQPHRRPRGERHGMAVLTDAQVAEMRAAYADGAKQVELQRRFGVSKPTVYRVLHKRGYRA